MLRKTGIVGLQIFVLVQYGIGPTLNLMQRCSLFCTSNNRLRFVSCVEITSFFC